MSSSKDNSTKQNNDIETSSEEGATDVQSDGKTITKNNNDTANSEMSDAPSISSSPNNNNNKIVEEEDNLEEEDNDNNNDVIANGKKYNREGDDVNDEENDSDGNKSTSDENKAFNELLDMVTYIDKASVRQPKREVSWKDFDTAFGALEKNLVKKVLMCEDTSSGNESLLMWLLAVEGGPPHKIVDTIIQIYPEVIKTKDKWNQTCLHYCIWKHASPEVTKAIMETYPEAILQKKDGGITPLHNCIRHNASLPLIQMIVEQYPSVVTVIENDRGQIPLLLARKKGNATKEIENYLQKMTPEERTQTLDFVFYDLVEMITIVENSFQKPKKKRDIKWDKFNKKLLALDPDMKKKVTVYQDPDDFAKRSLLLYLLTVEGGPPVTLVDTILRIHPEAIRAKDNEKWTCLIYTIYYKSSAKVTQVIMDSHAEAILEKDDDGCTPLHYIQSNTSLRVVRKMVEQYPMITAIKDNDGQIPLQLAEKENASEEVLQYLFEQQEEKD